MLLYRRYRTEYQPKRMLREKQKHLLSNLKMVSSHVSDMAVNDPWKLIQRAFEYGFLLNGLAQVRVNICIFVRPFTRHLEHCTGHLEHQVL